MLRIGIVAGEYSGDTLGAGLVRELKKRVGNVSIEGILGPRLISEGGRSMYPMDMLAVTGLTEVLFRYPRLLIARNRLIRHFMNHPPDIFIGIDAPDFNIGIEQQLRRHGIRTAHYVSPSVWAWRRGRIKKLSEAVDLLLLLYPFEPELYRDVCLHAEYVGHPLADMISIKPDMYKARSQLGLDPGKTIIAILPGSRVNELDRHLDSFLHAARWCHEKRPELTFVISFQNKILHDMYSRQVMENMQGLPFHINTGGSLRVMEAANVILLASGTAALEAMLLKKPMVVGYRVSFLSYQLLRNLVHIPFISLPNILSGRQIVPELLQNDMTPERLGAAVIEWLDSPGRVQRLQQEFTEMHSSLRNQADSSAASAILALCRS